jgi:hypothetical protein
MVILRNGRQGTNFRRNMEKARLRAERNERRRNFPIPAMQQSKAIVVLTQDERVGLLMAFWRAIIIALYALRRRMAIA